jgi:hypothetical protein
MRKKMVLKDKTKAIFCYSGQGPCFGKDDLLIENQYEYSNSFFPTSYNSI